MKYPYSVDGGPGESPVVGMKKPVQARDAGVTEVRGDRPGQPGRTTSLALLDPPGAAIIGGLPASAGVRIAPPGLRSLFQVIGNQASR